MANYRKRHREGFWRRRRKDAVSSKVAERVNDATLRKVARFFNKEAKLSAPKEAN